MRIIAFVVLFLAAVILFGESTDETPIRVLLSAVLLGASLVVLFRRKRLPIALLLWALLLPLHSVRVPWILILALAAAVAAFVMLVVRRERKQLEGYEAVGDGAPFVEVEPRTFRHPTARVFAVITLVIPAIGLVAGAVAGMLVAVVVSAAALLTFALIWLLAWRPRYRVDAEGIHGRMFFGDVTVCWPDVVLLETHSASMGYMMRDYAKICCVHSKNNSVRFYDTIVDAEELKQIVAAATGITWPA